MNPTPNTEKSNDQPSTEKVSDIYTQIRVTIATWLEDVQLDHKVQSVLLLVPDLFALLARLITDDRVDIFHKLELGIAITYVISPFDILPDFLPPLGYIDDALVMVLVLSRLLSITGKAGEDIVRQNWEGEEDILEVIRSVATKAN